MKRKGRSWKGHHKVWTNKSPYVAPEENMRKTICKLKNSAKRRNIQFIIGISDISPIPSECPDLKIPLRFFGKKTANTATIDRIDPFKGYIPGNVRVVSYKANAMKQNATKQELEVIVRSWSELITKM